jgi:hypothetical protein
MLQLKHMSTTAPLFNKPLIFTIKVKRKAIGSQMAVRFLALRIGLALLPKNIIFLLLILIYVRLSEPQVLIGN